MTRIIVTVNGDLLERSVPTDLRLLDFIRNDLRLTGTKEVCAEGECGACSVMLNEQIVCSCLIFAVEIDGGKLTTIEQISQDDRFSELQQAFMDHHSVQCGFCIPGMILAGEQILRENPNPSRDEIKQKLAGNICRCTGYQKIVNAIESQ